MPAHSPVSTYTPAPGESIQVASKSAAELAARNSVTVAMKFNDVSLTVTRGDKPEDVVAAYWRIGKERAEAYRNSPDGKAAAAKELQETAARQVKLDSALRQLAPALSQGLTSTIQWTKEYTDLAGYTGTNDHRAQVLTALTAAGYKANEYTGAAFVEGDKQIMGRYIMGQVVDNLQGGMPPHQVAAHFADQYLAMPDKVKIKPVTFKAPGR